MSYSPALPFFTKGHAMLSRLTRYGIFSVESTRLPAAIELDEDWEAIEFVRQLERNHVSYERIEQILDELDCVNNQR